MKGHYDLGVIRPNNTMSLYKFWALGLKGIGDERFERDGYELYIYKSELYIITSYTT